MPTPRRFQGFPYLVTRAMAAVYCIDPMSADCPTAELKALAWKRVHRTGLRCCLVLSPSKCIYFEPEGKEVTSKLPPSGGLTFAGKSRTLQLDPEASELAERRERLHQYVDQERSKAKRADPLYPLVPHSLTGLPGE
jgi:hypothetical protein